MACCYIYIYIQSYVVIIYLHSNQAFNLTPDDTHSSCDPRKRPIHTGALVRQEMPAKRPPPPLTPKAKKKKNLVAPVDSALGVLLDRDLADGPDLAALGADGGGHAGAAAVLIAAEVGQSLAEGHGQVVPGVGGQGSASGGGALVGTVEGTGVEGS